MYHQKLTNPMYNEKKRLYKGGKESGGNTNVWKNPRIKERRIYKASGVERAEYRQADGKKILGNDGREICGVYAGK
jgi:hypothetical protein